MKMKKRRFIAVFMIMMIIVGSSLSWAMTFEDVQSTDWFYQDVTDLSQIGVISGMGDGTFHPLDSVRVDEFIKMIVFALGYSGEPGEGYWAEPFINRALELELIKAGEFAVYTRQITRGEMATIISRAISGTTSNVMYDYSLFMKDYLLHQDKAILEAFYKGIITGYPDGNFYPEKLATRAEASAMLLRMILNNRRIDTNRLGVLEDELMDVKETYMTLKDQYIQIYEAGIDPTPYEYETGDLLFESSDSGIDAYLWADGDLFVGEIEEGHFGDLGYFRWIDHSEYMGELMDDMRMGQGIMIFEDAMYTGDFHMGELTGDAMLEWQDGYFFIGQFEEGKVKGLAKRVMPDGGFHLGYFVDGQPEGYGLYSDKVGISYFGTFNKGEMDFDEAIMYDRGSSELPFVDEVERIIESTIEVGMSTDQKIRALHDYLIDHVAYDQAGYDSGEIPYISHTAYGALVNGKAVCDGYASAFNLLLNEVGIESDLVFGMAGEENHAWNEVAFTSGKYYVDVTWDDGDNGEVYTQYYKKTLEEMNEDHMIEQVIR